MTPGIFARRLHHPMFLTAVLLLLPVAVAGRLPVRNESPPPVSPPGSSTDVLTPEHDWIAAFQAGGTVRLGPGDYRWNETIEITRDLAIIGVSGAQGTVIHLDSNGGQYREQLAVVGEGDRTVQVSISGVAIVHGGSHVSDLITVYGNAHLNLESVGVGLAFDELNNLYDPDGDGNWWGSGILVLDGAQLTVHQSFFYGNITGIASLAGGQISVDASSFVDNFFSGIYVEDTPITVTGSSFEGNEVGIEIYGTAVRLLNANSFTDQLYTDVIEEH